MWHIRFFYLGSYDLEKVGGLCVVVVGFAYSMYLFYYYIKIYCC